MNVYADAGRVGGLRAGGSGGGVRTIASGPCRAGWWRLRQNASDQKRWRRLTVEIATELIDIWLTWILGILPPPPPPQDRLRVTVTSHWNSLECWKDPEECSGIILGEILREGMENPPGSRSGIGWNIAAPGWRILKESSVIDWLGYSPFRLRRIPGSATIPRNFLKNPLRISKSLKDIFKAFHGIQQNLKDSARILGKSSQPQRIPNESHKIAKESSNQPQLLLHGPSKSTHSHRTAKESQRISKASQSIPKHPKEERYITSVQSIWNKLDRIPPSHLPPPTTTTTQPLPARKWQSTRPTSQNNPHHQEEVKQTAT